MNWTGETGNRIFRRLLIFNLITVIVITTVPLLVSYRYFKTAYESEINGLNMQTVRQFRQAIDEQVLKTIVNVPNVYLSELESNEALTVPLTRDISRQSAAILRVSRRIDDIKNSMPFVHSIDLYYTRSNLLFRDTNVCMLSESACDLGASGDWLERFRTSDLNIEWLGARRAGTYDAAIVASYVRSIPYFVPRDKRQAVVAVNVDVSALGELLRAVKTPEEGTLLIVDARGRVIADNRLGNGEAAGQTPSFAPQLPQAEQGETGMIYDKLDGRSHVISYAASQYNSWRYVSVTSVEHFYEKSRQLTSWLAAIGAAFLGVNLLITLLLTRQAHKPISSRMATLQQSLARHQPIVRHNAILGMLSGAAMEGQTPEGGDSAQAIRFTHERVRAFVVQLRPSSGERLTEEELAACFHLIEQLEAGLPEAAIHAIKDERHRILGILHYDPGTPLERLTAALDRLVQSNLPPGSVLSLGGSQDAAAAGVAASYREARQARSYAFLYPEATVLVHEALHVETRSDSGSAVKVLDDIAASLRSGDGARLRGLIGSVLDEARSGAYTVQYCRNMLMDVVSTIRRTVKSLGFSSSELFGGDIREQFKSIPHIDAFEQWIEAQTDRVLDSLEARKQQLDQAFAERVLTFIGDNLFNQLSLDLVADYANVSPTYLSKMFKVMTGSNFSEYVTALKLEQAALLLREKRLSVQDISAKIGYNSTHHFIRLFKEKYGSTPKQYQKALPDPETPEGEEDAE
ncbi:AraC family transcriptional regulator [Paenibacillus sp. IB182496]|uniref:AraC family transcriptional regulator n=1 Tax=Paenibacillus sabuli TaxID=2772509 RepID=A0A927GT46_9BACL|nr:AraC family transcriptional regulator [Paenibacillus sabuli]MBD2847439.1 AraC family transcriptional regulator [Paenibacillus sabuli]